MHRDIKPENLFVTRQGRLKVMDFGLARTDEASTVTVAGMLAGTPAYMSPEQIRSLADAGPAGDQYALGVVAFELLAGRPPFVHGELLPLLRMHAEAPPPSVRAFQPGAPSALDAVLHRGLAKRPEDRFPDCCSLARALAEAAGVPPSS